MAQLATKSISRMTDDTSSMPPEDGREEHIARLVEEFMILREGAQPPSAREFCERQPEDIRSELQQRCDEMLEIQRTLRHSAAGTSQRKWLGEFRLERLLGSGSFGDVWLAWQKQLTRWVALKVLTVNPRVDLRAVERFRREAAAAGRLRHPNIVPVHAIGEADGQFYLAMDYIEGATLAQALENTQNGAGSDGIEEKAWHLPTQLGSSTQRGYPGRVARIIAQLADALQYAHDQQVIHRDIKPKNILLDQEGVPFLVDFGLAKDLTDVSLSRVGEHAGTPCYMSPEQALAKRVPIDHRTDVFSLGVVMYELLALRRPFGGESLDRLFYEISFKQPVRLRKVNPRVPRDLETICHRALEKSPDHRFARAGDMAENLQRFLNHESILVRPPNLYVTAWRYALRHPVVASATAALLMASVLLPFLFAHVAHAAKVRSLLQPLLELAQVTDLAEVPVEQLLGASRSAERAAAQIDDLALEDRQLVEQQQLRLRAFGQDEMDRGLAQIDASFSAKTLGSMSERLVGFASGIQHLMTSSLLLPDREVEALTSTEPWFPTLSLDSNPGAATVFLQRLDPMDGVMLSSEPLGPTPVNQRSVDPGLYRILIRHGDDYAELTRSLDTPRTSYALGIIQIRSTEDAREGMVLISDEEFTFGKGSAQPYHERRAVVPSFWIGEAEVTNGKYREFVDATGHEPPPIWPTPYDPAWDELPVAAVDYLDARAYCEWAGGRLPTVWEWERAARGTQGLSTAAELGDPPGGYVLAEAPIPPPPTREFGAFWDHVRAAYRRAVRSASAPETRGPEGLFHTLGNVREWTDTQAFLSHAGGPPILQPGLRITKGGSWCVTIATLSEFDPTPADMRDRSIGFRIAKSLIE